jgi:hypothetical protein
MARRTMEEGRGPTQQNNEDQTGFPSSIGSHLLEIQDRVLPKAMQARPGRGMRMRLQKSPHNVEGRSWKCDPLALNAVLEARDLIRVLISLPLYSLPAHRWKFRPDGDRKKYQRGSSQRLSPTQKSHKM